VRVVVSQTTEGWRGEIELGEAASRATRTFDGESCAAVAEAATIMIAIARDRASPSRSMLGREAREASAASGAERSRAELDAYAARADSVDKSRGAIEPARPSARAVNVSAAFVGQTSALPAGALGAELALGWRGSHFAIESSLAAFLPRTATLASSPSEGADLAMTRLAVRACYFVAASALFVGPCAAPVVSWIRAHGFGADAPSDGSALDLAASLGAVALVPLGGGFALKARVGAEASLSRPRFAISSNGAGGPEAIVFQVPPFGVDSALGVEFSF
jgi:hypothetical protein